MASSSHKSSKRSYTSYKATNILPVVIGFALIGGIYALNKSHASVISIGQEAENGSVVGNAGAINATNASGDLAVSFGLNGGGGTQGRILLVAKTGTQYSSIQSAANAAQPGDTILISGGVYSEALNPSSGVQGKPITFKARSGQRVVVDGNKVNQSGDGLLNLDARGWINFEGITFDRSPTHGIYGLQAHDIVFKNCEISHSSNGGLVMVGSSHIIVDNCSVHDNNDIGQNASHEAITMAEATTNYEIMHCRVFNNNEQGIEARNDSNNGSIHDNQIYNNHEANVYINSSSDVQIYNNTIYSEQQVNKTGIVVGIEDDSTTRRVNNIRIYNNILYNNLDGALAFTRQNAGLIQNVSIINNTIVDNEGGGITGIDELAAIGNVTRNNIFFNNVSGIGDPLSNETNYTQDPKFVNPSGHDYHLKTGSGALNSGTATGAPTFDHDNKTRPQGGRVDIGAYEQ